MRYRVELKPRAVKDLKGLPQADQRRMVEKLRWLAADLQGDVKKLTDFSPEYRLRAGAWRVLFEIESEQMMVLTPQILEKDGEKQFVILPYEQFVELQEALEDLEDIKALRAAKSTEGEEPTIPLADVERELGL